MIRQNLHTHTTFCDGKNSPEEMVQAALELDMDSLGFSGHSPLPGEDWVMEAGAVPRYRQEVLGLRERYASQLEIFLGLERDILSPAPEGEYDYLIGSVHALEREGELLSVDESEQTLRRNVERWFGGEPLAFAEEYYRQVGAVAEKTGCQIVGHFDLVCKFNEGGRLFDTGHPRYRRAALEALERLKSREVILEINTGAMSRGYRTAPYPEGWILKRARELGLPICLTSDAHSRQHLMYAFAQGAQLARSCGYGEAMYLTRAGFALGPLPDET